MLLAQTQYVLISRLAMPIGAFLLLIIIGRHSDQLLGEYALVTTFYYVMQTLPLLGLTPFVMREVARRPGAAGDYFVTIGMLSLAACVMVNLVTHVALTVTPYSPAVEQGVHIVGYSIFGGTLAFLGDIILISLGRARVVAVTAVVENLLRLVFSVVVLMRGGDVQQLIWVVFATRMLSFAVYTLLFWKIAPLPFRPDWSILKAARVVLPVFAASAVLMLMMSRMDFFVLSLYTSAAELGYYAIAYRLFEIVTLGVAGVTTAVFPRMSQQYVADRAGFLHSGRRLLLGVLTLLVPVGLAAYVGADLYVRLLFAEQYPEAVFLSRMIVLVLPLAGLNALSTVVLNASDHQAADLGALVLGILVFAAGLLLLVPGLLGLGAFAALALSTMAQAGLRLSIIHRRVGPLLSIGEVLGHAAVALAAFWVVHRLAGGAGTLGMLGLALAIMLLYPTLLLLLGLCHPLRVLLQDWRSGRVRPKTAFAGLLDVEGENLALVQPDGPVLGKPRLGSIHGAGTGSADGEKRTEK